jgi:hypothetical protein
VSIAHPKEAMMYRKISGLSVVPMLFVAILAAMAVIGLMRYGGHYIDYRTIRSVMEGLPADKMHTMRKGDISTLVEKRLKINNVRELNVRQILKVDRNKEATNLVVSYEVREPVFLNIDLVLMFNETFTYR